MINTTFIGVEESRIVNLLEFSLFFLLVTIGVVYVPEWIESGLITGLDQIVRAVRSCNSWCLALKSSS